MTDANDSFRQTCECRNAGQDDGDTTCWIHHDCRDGSCTHIDEDYHEEREHNDENDY